MNDSSDKVYPADGWTTSEHGLGKAALLGVSEPVPKQRFQISEGVKEALRQGLFEPGALERHVPGAIAGAEGRIGGEGATGGVVDLRYDTMRLSNNGDGLLIEFLWKDKEIAYLRVAGTGLRASDTLTLQGLHGIQKVNIT